MKFVDIFAGIGGFRLGMERAGQFLKKYLFYVYKRIRGRKTMFPKPKKKTKYRYKPVPPHAIEKVRERSKGICEYCRQHKAEHPHHIHPRGVGV